MVAVTEDPPYNSRIWCPVLLSTACTFWIWRACTWAGLTVGILRSFLLADNFRHALRAHEVRRSARILLAPHAHRFYPKPGTLLPCSAVSSSGLSSPW